MTKNIATERYKNRSIGWTLAITNTGKYSRQPKKNNKDNFSFSLILRCRQEARARFARIRADVLVKMELLDSKHVQEIVQQLRRLLTAFHDLHAANRDLLQENCLFPVEVDLSTDAFQYQCTTPVNPTVSKFVSSQ